MSPAFAFTGDKFEFRAVGASSPISTPVAYLNAAVAEAIDLMSNRIEEFGGGQEPPRGGDVGRFFGSGGQLESDEGEEQEDCGGQSLGCHGV